MQKITTFLTFRERGEEAVNFYVSIFKNSKIREIVRYEEDGMLPKGALLNATFELNGQTFFAMDGGPHFTFSQGTSLFVNCESQDEVDYFWEHLSEGGQKQPCGWLMDRYGVSWQIIPQALPKLLGDLRSDRSKRVMDAMLKMKKIDIKTLQKAYEE